MSLRRTLDSMALTVGRARSVPLSASCYVNRADMLALIERARAELPQELDEATALLVAHQEVLDAAEREGEQVLDDARSRAAAMVEDTVIVASAQARADAILYAARSEATRLLRSADEYCDRRLGLFQADLEKALTQVSNGRARLQERSELDTFAQESGLADAADAVDDAAYRASLIATRAVQEVHDQDAGEPAPRASTAAETVSDLRHGDDEPGVYDLSTDTSAFDGYDLTDAPGYQDADEATGAGEPVETAAELPVDVPGQSRSRDRVIDLTEAEPAGLGQSRSLQ